MPLSVFGHSSDSFCPTPGAVRTTYTESAIDPSGGGGGWRCLWRPVVGVRRV